ncbi:MAG: S1 family peptidase [bacterium]
MLYIIFIMSFYSSRLYSFDNLIIAGQEVKESYAPAVVQLTTNHYTDWSDDDFCTATWIGTNTLLTAAHCLSPLGKYEYDPVGKLGPYLSVEKNSMLINDQVIKVAKIILHQGSDLAVLITKENNKNYLPLSFEELKTGNPVQLIGYGANCHNCIFLGDGIKRVGTNTIARVSTLSNLKISPTRSNEVKSLALNEQKRLINNKMSWGQILIVGQADYKFFSSDYPYKRANVSNGDSGGPLVSLAGKSGIIGVASHAVKCKDKKHYGEEISPPSSSEISYGDILNSQFFKATYDCKEEHTGYGYSYSIGEYTMVKESIAFFKFAIEKGADIKMINVDKQKYSEANTKNQYFIEF